jgi:hypothetical protein
VAEGIGYSDAYERQVLREFISSNKCKWVYIGLTISTTSA